MLQYSDAFFLCSTDALSVAVKRGLLFFDFCVQFIDLELNLLCSLLKWSDGFLVLFPIDLKRSSHQVLIDLGDQRGDLLGHQWLNRDGVEADVWICIRHDWYDWRCGLHRGRRVRCARNRVQSGQFVAGLPRLWILADSSQKSGVTLDPI